VSWEKIGVTVVSKPVAHGAGIYLRIPKRVVEAYDLITAEEIEVELARAKRKTPVEKEGEA